MFQKIFQVLSQKTWLYWLITSLTLFAFFLMVPSFVIHKFTGWDYFDSTYFSMVTFTTVGFGDLTITDYELKFMINFFSYFR